MALLTTALIGGAPAVLPLPEVGFWVVGFTPVRRASDRGTVIIEFADHTRGRFEPGDDVLGWTVIGIRRTIRTADRYALLTPPDGKGILELWPHLAAPRQDLPLKVQVRHLQWADWLHHCNQVDAIRYRAEGLIVVVGKPNGEPDDPDPFGPSKGGRGN